jgi:cyclic-di-AMP phosphodiesterase PgpH
MPGTYQHCLFLGHLAEAAATSIDANALFCKVSILYHDIGKLHHPQYFSENQIEDSHVGLTPLESAKLIIEHVKEGEKIAKENHLPSSFIDIIKEHHGTTLVYYFYHKELERQGGNQALVDEKLFRYPGPQPHTKEAAIVMICDAVEAASRTLDDISEPKVIDMVEKVVNEKSEDGQFDVAPLTFEEIEKIKKSLVKTLLASHHIRVKYPERTQLR